MSILGAVGDPREGIPEQGNESDRWHRVAPPRVCVCADRAVPYVWVDEMQWARMQSPA